VPSLGSLAKRILLGRPFRSERIGETELSKRLALPIFASDPLSSVAYATQEVLVVLTLAGSAYLYLTPFLAAAVVLLLVVVVASYRQLVQAYPTGGGDYEVASKNLGRSAGVTVASALLVDYVMTVAVSVSAGIDNVISALRGLHPYRVWMAVGVVLLLSAANLRGVRESGKAFALPTYAFVVGVLGMVATGLVRTFLGHPPVAESARFGIRPEHGHLVGLAFAFFVLRAFSSGCTALTGVEAIANGVPAFKKPKGKNAAATLLAMGVISMTMFVGITALAMISKVHYVDPTRVCDLIGFRGCTTEPQPTVIAQIAAAVFGGHHNVLFYYLQAVTALILVLAANTAFNGFPLLGSILAQDRFAPRQLHTRGDRLVYSNGIVLLATAAGFLIVAFKADVTKLIQLYIIGVFTSFTLGQSGMVRHWNKLLRTESDPVARRRMIRSRAINATGATFTGLVLVIVLITKFTKGAYLVVIAMPLLFLLMQGIRRHYDHVAHELEPTDDAPTLPARNHAVVLVSKVHQPTLRSIAYARATRPDTLTAVTVNVDEPDTRALQEEWERREVPVPLEVVESPYREITRPILDYIKRIRRDSPRDVVTVYIPEYVVGHWWEHLLHNQSALRLKSRLLFEPGVMVTNVPWQLKSSEQRGPRPQNSPGDVRRGVAGGEAEPAELPSAEPERAVEGP
jgi:amino acid transporter